MADQSEYRQEMKSYVTGLLLALGLTAIPFALVAWKLLPASWVLIITFTLGLIQVLVHFRYFLHIGWQSHRDDLYLLLFSSLIVLLMVGGTLVIIFNLHHRMM